ncbi:MAG: HlyD family efflux transporter periplasmic adaptor subunit [Planctomycetaceae bacterium]|nr:HlyD family efflux transporter periplasmic adaptor subunit [Planctomycetaceae bacterium]MCB9937525.1 HlyD family efflux transporter periplasmic adaptor subunit [Planctomycetaceae bacterium]HRX78223.1 HlyD family efflux transporter periplasmic adaptor subunit [Pirellulaceae bacterium]
MRGNTSSPQIDGSDEAWSEIEALVDETAKLAREPMSVHEFHAEFVRRVVQATDACGVVLWSAGTDGVYSIAAQIEPPDSLLPSDHSLHARNQNIHEVAARRQTASLLPRQSDHLLRNPTIGALLLQPVVVDDRTVAVIETYHEDVASPSQANNLEQMVAVFGDLLADFHRNHQLLELRQRASAWTVLEEFVEQVHRSIDLKSVAFVIANEAARVMRCDRVTVFRHRDAGCRTLSISGIDTFDRRSTLVRGAERLAQAVAVSDEPLWYSRDGEVIPPQLEARLQLHLDAAHVRSLVVVPLAASIHGQHRESVGVLLFERFEDSSWDESQRQRIEVISRHATTALRNANELAGLPLIGASRLLRRCLSPFASRHLPKTAAVAVLLTAIVAAFCLIPSDFNIEGDGQLMPVSYRHIFAPADGVIEEIHVDHATKVTQGTTLIEMRRSELELEEARLLGEVLTNQKRLDSVRSALLNHKAASATSANEFHELTSEEARLKILLASLREQQEILKRERAELTIVSPIDGEVITWGIEDQLSHRPVRRGERLLSVVDPNGAWHVELRIADRDIDHVIAARRNTEELTVTFIVKSHAGRELRGTVENIAMSTELDEHDHSTVLVLVALDREQLSELRPGASVVAKVHCGSRSIGYVWFRELFEVIKTRVLF